VYVGDVWAMVRWEARQEAFSSFFSFFSFSAKMPQRPQLSGSSSMYDVLPHTWE